jgi:hypothetical protein
MLNFNATTMKFFSPLSIAYMDNPSNELVERIVRASGQLRAEQVPEFVGPAASILKKYNERKTNKDAATVRRHSRSFLCYQIFSSIENQ